MFEIRHEIECSCICTYMHTYPDSRIDRDISSLELNDYLK